MTSSFFDERVGKNLFFKCELFQKARPFPLLRPPDVAVFQIGAFKIRGATNAVLQMTPEQKAKGVITHSSGNHAQAIALAAKRAGIAATIVMPTTAPAIKKDAVLGYGAEVIDCAPDKRAETQDAIIAKEGQTPIGSYNHPHVMAGQGTLGLELIDQCSEMGSELDLIIVPIGGGGMISGVATAAKGRNEAIRIIAAEPELAADAAESKRTGVRQGPVVGTETIADGLCTALGTLTWPVVRDKVECVITVSESEIEAAMELVWTRMKLCIEASAAVGVAVAMSPKFQQLEGIKDVKNIGIVLCGGNVDVRKLPWMNKPAVESGLLAMPEAPELPDLRICTSLF